MIRITKTLGPIHFEDLDPHRFEDLVRELAYDFKEWQSIEATGRSGSDEGFDIRAWEKTQEITNKDDQEEDSEGVHPMDGNLWMIQCKREKAMGPTKIAEIIKSAVNKKTPPYGYILAASASFSKKSYDTFREELRKKGVMEFHLWGKAELEDMLHQPKNDHTLFTFFGISLVTRKRTRAREIKFTINNKNKLLRVLSDGEQTQNMWKPVLVRDIKDTYYPYKDEYKDFEKNPRWEEHMAFGYTSSGLLIHASEYYAYVDAAKKEWDFTKAVDLVIREKEIDTHRGDKDYYKKRERVEDFWKHTPRRNQATLHNEGLIRFEDMLVIDDKGDILYDFPHIFVDFQPQRGTFKGIWNILHVANREINIREEPYKRIKVFPASFPAITKSKLHKEESVQWDEETLRLFKIGGALEDTLFDVDGKYSFLSQRDAITVAGITDGDNVPSFIKITHKYTTTIDEYLKERSEQPYLRQSIERQVGRSIKSGENLVVFEFERSYGWEFKSK